MPIIPASIADRRSRCDDLAAAVAGLMEQKPQIDDPPTEIGFTNFYLTYHDRNNREIQQNIAALLSQACPQLIFTAPHCRNPLAHAKKRLDIGFISANLRNHTIGKLTLGMIQNWRRDRFHVTVFRLSGAKDDISTLIDSAADRVITLENNLIKDQQSIADVKPDILFYPDIGMNPFTYFLAFSRLAPVQAVTWGHPDTTGLGNIDFFLSSTLLEPDDAQEHYSEKLVLLPQLPVYYHKPEVPAKRFSRADFGLPQDANIYLCPQTLFKFHPAFDAVLGKLLKQDKKGRLVLIEDKHDGSLKKAFIPTFQSGICRCRQ